jgi:hypothetical protein
VAAGVGEESKHIEGVHGSERESVEVEELAYPHILYTRVFDAFAVCGMNRSRIHSGAMLGVYSKGYIGSCIAVKRVSENLVASLH